MSFLIKKEPDVWQIQWVMEEFCQAQNSRSKRETIITHFKTNHRWKAMTSFFIFDFEDSLHQGE